MLCPAPGFLEDYLRLFIDINKSRHQAPCTGIHGCVATPEHGDVCIPKQAPQGNEDLCWLLLPILCIQLCSQTCAFY